MLDTNEEKLEIILNQIKENLLDKIQANKYATYTEDGEYIEVVDVTDLEQMVENIYYDLQTE